MARLTVISSIRVKLINELTSHLTKFDSVRLDGVYIYSGKLLLCATNEIM